MSQQKLLERVISALDQSGIPYMLTGSLVSSLQGEPRATHDIDVVVALDEIGASKLQKIFQPPDFYLDPERVTEAIRTSDSFNLIEVTTGDKVDFWMLTDEPFDRSRFARRYAEEVLGIHAQFSRPEDTILAKLRWAKLAGGSEKQLTDALRVYELQYGTLDLDYLRRWAAELGVTDLMGRIEEEAEVV